MQESCCFRKMNFSFLLFPEFKVSQAFLDANPFFQSGLGSRRDKSKANLDMKHYIQIHIHMMLLDPDLDPREKKMKNLLCILCFSD